MIGFLLHYTTGEPWNGYQSGGGGGVPTEKPLSVPLNIYNCQRRLSARAAASADVSRAILCVMYVSAFGKWLQWDRVNVCTPYMNGVTL